MPDILNGLIHVRQVSRYEASTAERDVNRPSLDANSVSPCDDLANEYVGQRARVCA